MMNQLMLEIKNYYIANEIVKLIKKYFINFKKVIKRLQVILFKQKEKINYDVQTITISILNDFKCVYNKIYINLSISI